RIRVNEPQLPSARHGVWIRMAKESEAVRLFEQVINFHGIAIEASMEGGNGSSVFIAAKQQLFFPVALPLGTDVGENRRKRNQQHRHRNHQDQQDVPPLGQAPGGPRLDFTAAREVGSSVVSLNLQLQSPSA